MTKLELAAALEAAKTWSAQFPVSGPVLARLAERLTGGEPALWTALAASWLERRFWGPSEPLLLLLNGLHAEMLRRPDKPLARFFPTCRGQAGDLRAALDQELDSPSKELLDNLARRSSRRYEPVWSTLWLEHAMSFFQIRGLPYYVAEIGTIAGLHAAADLLLPNDLFKSALIAGRVGFCESPLDLEALADRQWLLGAAAPEALDVFAETEDVIQRYRALRKDGQPPVELVDCDALTAVQSLAGNIKPRASVGLLVLTTWQTQRMTPQDFADFRVEMAALFKRWGERALWIELGPTPGGRADVDFRLAGYRIKNDLLVAHILARFEVTPAGVSALADAGANRAFLS